MLLWLMCALKQRGKVHMYNSRPENTMEVILLTIKAAEVGKLLSDLICQGEEVLHAYDQ